MKYVVTLLICVSIVLTLPVRSQQSHHDFSGKWVANKARSDFGKTSDGRERGPRNPYMEIVQDEKTLKIRFESTDREGMKGTGPPDRFGQPRQARRHGVRY